MNARLHEPSEQLMKAWNFICEKSSFITPELIAQAAQIGHDTAAEYLLEWLENGVLERTPRYPQYVYSRSQDWQKTIVAQRFNQRM